MTTDDEGFVLAMRFASENSEFIFDSEYWTNTNLVDEFDMSPTKDADGKFVSFVNMVAFEIKGCLPHGCKKFTLSNPKTLQSLFADTPVSSTSFPLNDNNVIEWARYAGVTTQTNWQASGINFDDDRSNYHARVRFGALFNNEYTIQTANDAVGFGAVDAGGAGVGAGASTYNSQMHPMKGTIWVKPEYSYSPGSTYIATFTPDSFDGVKKIFVDPDAIVDTYGRGSDKSNDFLWHHTTTKDVHTIPFQFVGKGSCWTSDHEHPDTNAAASNVDDVSPQACYEACIATYDRFEDMLSISLSLFLYLFLYFYSLFLSLPL